MAVSIVGNGTLLISNGGSVASGGRSVSGSAAVDGLGSTWADNGSLAVSTLFDNKRRQRQKSRWHASGTASLVTVDGPRLDLERQRQPLASATVAAVRSQSPTAAVLPAVAAVFPALRQSTAAAQRGPTTVVSLVAGTLSITNGGRVGSLGGTASGTASLVTVDGPARGWTDSGNLCVGNAGGGRGYFDYQWRQRQQHGRHHRHQLQC